jgi:hypothetical protein
MSRFTVEFRIYGKALEPSALTELLALKPCQVVQAGSRRGSRIVTKRCGRSMERRMARSAGNPEWSTLEEGLKSVLKKLRSRRELITQYNGASRKIWWCGQFRIGFNSGATLSVSLLAELAEFGADLFIDSYA